MGWGWEIDRSTSAFPHSPGAPVCCRIIHVYDLTSGPQEFSKRESSLKMQTRCVACFPTRDGYALGTIQGRVSINYVSEGPAERNFSFRCHRVSTPGHHSSQKKDDIYAVNSISFHPRVCLLPLTVFSSVAGNGGLYPLRGLASATLYHSPSRLSAWFTFSAGKLCDVGSGWCVCLLGQGRAAED